MRRQRKQINAELVHVEWNLASGLNRVGDLKARIDELRSAAEKFQREGDLEAASRILYGELPALERELNEAAEAESARVAGGGAKQDLMVAEEVTAEVKAIVAELGAKGPGDMGKVMGAVKARLAGKADMGDVSKLVKQRLSGG